MFLTFTDVTEIVDETVEEEECKTIEEEVCSQPAPQFGEKCQDVEVSTVQISEGIKYSNQEYTRVF